MFTLNICQMHKINSLIHVQGSNYQTISLLYTGEKKKDRLHLLSINSLREEIKLIEKLVNIWKISICNMLV